MKIVSEKHILILLLLVCGTVASQENDVPEPGPPPPPNLEVPIDENILILFSVAMLFGIYIIYRNNIKVKNPI
jgi:hypothetical protein